jgi:hypothetical protein
MSRNRGINAATKGGTSTVTTHPDPVVDLSRHLLDLWDADDASQVEHHHSSNDVVGRDIQQQFGDWQEAVAKIISFTQATSLAGALVQMALAVDELDSLLNVVVCAEDRPLRQLSSVDEHRIVRLIRSAMRAVSKSPETDVETVRSFVKIYTGYDDRTWLDNVQQWAQEGQKERRKSEGG